MAVKKLPSKARGTPASSKLPDYGWPPRPGVNPLTMELGFFRRKNGSYQQKGPVVNGKMPVYNPTKGKPRWYHFIKIVDILWNYQGSPRPFAWHPDALRMLKAACKYDRLGVPGAGSTGKSDFFAIWAIVNWLANTNSRSIKKPDGEEIRKEGCKVLVTSTTKSAAANRIWGKVMGYWHAMIVSAPGKLIGSKYQICYCDPTTGAVEETSGIQLVAGEASQDAKSADDIRGIKGDPLIVIVDEMPETSHSLVNTFDENLSANYNNQLVGLGNPDSYFDPFGDLCEPENGWESVGDDDMEWKAKKGGYVVRLDAEQSPNILEGRVIFPFLMQPDQLAKRTVELGGRTTPAYYRGIRGMWCRTTAEQTIYSQTEIMLSEACKPAKWRGEKVFIGGFDVAFTHDGDRSVLYVSCVGVTVEGKLTLEFVKPIMINEDTRIKDVDRTTQIVRKLKEECERHNISLENLGIDASGPGGKAFRDAVRAQWGSQFLAVDFSGAPSEKPVSSMDKTPCNKRYDRRVSELWFGGKALLRADQLRGIGKELAAEMVIRKYRETKPASADNRIIVETKREMKARTQRSPDCFIAGTMVLTTEGEKAIELIQEGDMVITPMGASPVIKTHCVQTKGLTELQMSNGRTLVGKGAHKVYTRREGWVAMENISLTTTLESASDLPLWNFLSTLSTRVENTDFKPLVDTIKTRTTHQGEVRRRDFFTESSGLTKKGLFLKACVSITKMVIGLITGSETWSSWKVPSTCGCTASRGGTILKKLNECERLWKKPVPLLQHGTDLPQGLHGIKSTPKTPSDDHGFFGLQSASSVGLRTKPRPKKEPPSSAPLPAVIEPCSETAPWRRAFALAVGAISALNSTLFGKPVRSLAVSSYTCEPVAVYNLTLLQENVYYANGVLVQNCADAAFIAIEVARTRHKFVSTEKPAERANGSRSADPVKKRFAQLASVYNAA